MQTKCSRCIHRTDPNYDCLQYEITATELNGMLYVKACAGFTPQEQQATPPTTAPTPIDQTAQPDTVTA